MARDADQAEKYENMMQFFKRLSKRLVRMCLWMKNTCSALASRTKFYPRHPPRIQSKGIKYMFFWFWKVTKSTIF